MSDIDGITASAAKAIANHARVGAKKNYDHHRCLCGIETALTLWCNKLLDILGGPLVPELSDNVKKPWRIAGGSCWCSRRRHCSATGRVYLQIQGEDAERGQPS